MAGGYAKMADLMFLVLFVDKRDMNREQKEILLQARLGNVDPLYNYILHRFSSKWKEAEPYIKQDKFLWKWYCDNLSFFNVPPPDRIGALVGVTFAILTACMLFSCLVFVLFPSLLQGFQ